MDMRQPHVSLRKGGVQPFDHHFESASSIYAASMGKWVGRPRADAIDVAYLYARGLRVGEARACCISSDAVDGEEKGASIRLHTILHAFEQGAAQQTKSFVCSAMAPLLCGGAV